MKVLQRSYYGKIKMIYIDPPYNTGNDSFIYPDRFKEEKDDYELRAGIKDAEGLLTKDGFWRKNSKDAGHFHSNWLSMMYPRLFLARNLLRQDAFFVVSIDDAELTNLQLMLNEIFGEENYIATLVWDRNRKNDAKYFSVGHEYMLVYAKDREYLKSIDTILRHSKEGVAEVKDEYERLRKLHSDDWRSVKTGLMQFFDGMSDDDPRKQLARFNKVDDKGPYRDDGNINWPGGGGPRYEVLHPVTGKPCKIPRSGWRYPTKKRMDEVIAKGRVVFGETEETVPSVRTNLFDNSTQVMKSVNYSYAQTATVMFNSLFGGKRVFDNPKHSEDIQQIVNYLTAEDDITLDFFAGSCTTAHAVMQLNAEDGGNRKFICVQLAEPCEEESEAFKAGFKTIADIGKERIRRAAKKIKEENKGKLDFDGKKTDLGFKVLKLEQSNFKQWRENVKTGEELKEQMKMFVDNTTKGAKPDDMLFEIILKNSRFDLNVKVEKQSFDGVDYYRLADGVEIVCLASKITKKFIDKALEGVKSEKSVKGAKSVKGEEAVKCEKFTCLDIAFKDNDQLKTNTALQMEAAKIEFKVI